MTSKLCQRTVSLLALLAIVALLAIIAVVWIHFGVGGSPKSKFGTNATAADRREDEEVFQGSLFSKGRMYKGK